MRSFVSVKRRPRSPDTSSRGGADSHAPGAHTEGGSEDTPAAHDSIPKVLAGTSAEPAFFLSDLSDDDGELGDDEDDDDEPIEARGSTPGTSRSAVEAVLTVPKPPPRKRRKLAVPARQARADAKAKTRDDRMLALKDRARAVESCLVMHLHNGRRLMDASSRAAESHKFSPKWGGRLVRRWVRAWVEKRQLPSSQRGRHVKICAAINGR